MPILTWLRNTDAWGAVSYEVLGGYHARRHLKAKGFAYDSGAKTWRLTLDPPPDPEQVAAIETLLQTLGRKPRAPGLPYTVRG